MPKITIEDISRETGLSRGTVSRALNDRPDISTATRQRVLDACAKLKFTPSFAARSLATGRYFSLAALVDARIDIVGCDILRGAGAGADEARYALQLISLPPAPAVTARIRALAAERIDGLLLATPLSADDISLLQQAIGDRPIVACFAMDSGTFDVVSPDRVEAGRLAARTLLQYGARQLLHARAGRSAEPDAHRAGFVEACAAAGIQSASVRFAEIYPESPTDALMTSFTSADGIACSEPALAAEVAIPGAPEQGEFPDAT